MKEDHKDRAQQPQLNIELSEETAEGVYSNLVMIAHSPEEFILDFIRVMPGVPKARVRSRIIITPQHAKRFFNALQDNLDKYETAYGVIGDRAPHQMFQFQMPEGEA